jgi:hypothetical protein
MKSLLLCIYLSRATFCLGYGSASSKLSLMSLVEMRDSVLSAISVPIGTSDSRINGLSTNRLPSFELKRLLSTLELSQARDLTFPNLWGRINGDWKLRYTNNAESVIEGAGGLSGGVLDNKSSVITKVIQRIDGVGNRVDHILHYSIPLLTLSGTVTLQHECSVTSNSAPAQIAIDLAGVFVEGPLNPLKISAIQLPGPSTLRRGFFDVSHAYFFF